MPAPSLTPDQIAQVSGLVSQYISTERVEYSRHAIAETQSDQADGLHSEGTGRPHIRESLIRVCPDFPDVQEEHFNV